MTVGNLAILLKNQPSTTRRSRSSAALKGGRRRAGGSPVDARHGEQFEPA